MTQTALHRRRLLTAIGVGSVAALAGCNGGGPGIDGEPEYESGEIGDIDGEQRSEDELTAADALAEQEINGGVTALEGVSLTEHEFVFEGGIEGATVQGTVENTGDERIDLVEVRVRVSNDDGEQLGRYLDTTGDLEGGAQWAFQVVILEPPAELADYDITVLGTPT